MAVLSGAPALARMPLRPNRIDINDPLDDVLHDIARTSLPRHLSTWAKQPEKPIEVGDRFGGVEGTRYQVRQIIDDALLRAHDDLLDRDVLIRIVDAHDATETARATARLDHDGISRLIDFEQNTELSFFVMEAIGGDCLATETRGQLVGAARALAIAYEIADMLAHAHDRGVAHGRLDATRVVMTDDREVAVVGFGTVASQDGIVADIRALGALLYTMLSDESVPAKLAVRHHLALRRPDLDAQTIDLVCRAVEGDIDAAMLRDRLEVALVSLRTERKASAASWTAELRLNS